MKSSNKNCINVGTCKQVVVRPHSDGPILCMYATPITHSVLLIAYSPYAQAESVRFQEILSSEDSYILTWLF